MSKFKNNEGDVLLFADLNMDEIADSSMDNVYSLIDGLNADKKAKKEFLKFVEKYLLRPAFEGGLDAKHLGENLERVTKSAILEAADNALTEEKEILRKEAA